MRLKTKILKIFEKKIQNFDIRQYHKLVRIYGTITNKDLFKVNTDTKTYYKISLKENKLFVKLIPNPKPYLVK